MIFARWSLVDKNVHDGRSRARAHTHRREGWDYPWRILSLSLSPYFFLISRSSPLFLFLLISFLVPPSKWKHIGVRSSVKNYSKLFFGSSRSITSGNVKTLRTENDSRARRCASIVNERKRKYEQRTRTSFDRGRPKNVTGERRRSAQRYCCHHFTSAEK